MTPTTTTLTAACAAIDNVIRVNDPAGVTTNSILLVDAEEMHVEASYVSGPNVPVLRARGSSARADHVLGSIVTIDPYAALYDGAAFTKPQHDDLSVRLEGLIGEYADAGARATALGKLRDILKRLPVYDTHATPIGAAGPLRTDGPTLKEWLVAGNKEENYPPAGYRAIV